MTTQITLEERFATLGKQLEEQIAEMKFDFQENYVHKTKFEETIAEIKLDLEYNTKLNELEMKLKELEKKVEKAIMQKDEIFYQRHLERILGGRHTVTKHGISDIETENAFYEIKRSHLYKNAVGQLKAYSRGKPHKHLIAALFGEVSECRMKLIVEFLNSENIYVVLLKDLPDGNVVMVEYGKKIGDIEDLTSSEGVIKAFLSKKCKVSKNRNDRAFAKDVWEAFVDWKGNLKFSHVCKVKQNALYKHIDTVTSYDNKTKVLIKDERSTGWYGIKLLPSKT